MSIDGREGGEHRVGMWFCLRCPWALVLFLVLWPGAVYADLPAAVRYADGRNTRALIIWQAGRIEWESYGNGGGPQTAENVFSITKSMTALAVFSAIGRGWLRLDDPVAKTLPAWRDLPGKRAITVRQLLQLTSGLSPGYELYASSLRDKRAAALKVRMVEGPGTHFAYGPSHYEVLEALLAGQGPPLAWVKKSVLDPLGIVPAGWRRDREGQGYFSAGARLTARDLLALGHLVRRRGWKGIFPLIPPSLMDEARQGSSANAIYGLGFWLNRQAAASGVIERDLEEALAAGLTRRDWERTCLSRLAPADLVVMAGSEGQRVYISPSQRLVIVRLGRGHKFRDPDFLRAFFRPAKN